MLTAPPRRSDVSNILISVKYVTRLEKTGGVAVVSANAVQSHQDIIPTTCSYPVNPDSSQSCSDIS